uniref:Uncharacterized protein n=1 Tax=Glycine max TaxID=3847 RepID=C6TLW6_SOYBN|nr:unknown [Glycine max]
MHVTYQYVNMILVLPYSSFANINCKDEFTYDLLFASCSELFYSDCGKCSVTTRKGQIDICLPRNSRAVLMLMTSSFYLLMKIRSQSKGKVCLTKQQAYSLQLAG